MPHPSKSALDDPLRARLAWARYWRIMRWMAMLNVAVVAAALAYLGTGGGHLTLHLVIATVLGVSLTMLTGTGLMLLCFMSAGTGHDEEVQSGIDGRGW